MTGPIGVTVTRLPAWSVKDMAAPNPPVTTSASRPNSSSRYTTPPKSMYRICPPSLVTNWGPPARAVPTCPGTSSRSMMPSLPVLLALTSKKLAVSVIMSPACRVPSPPLMARSPW